MNHYTFEEIEIGHKESFTVTVTDKMRDKFREITGDVNPLHNDPVYAASKGHDGCVVYGMMTAAFLSTLAGVYLPGEHSLIHEVETKFRKPVYIGDTLVVEGEVTGKNETFSILEIKAVITNQDGVRVLKAKMKVAAEG